MIHNVPRQSLGIRQQVPLLGQQHPPPKEQQEQIARAQVMQTMNEMAVGMYVQLAVAHIGTRDQSLGQDVDDEQLRSMAKKCVVAAKAFFEGVGVIESAPSNEQGE